MARGWRCNHAHKPRKTSDIRHTRGRLKASTGGFGGGPIKKEGKHIRQGEAKNRASRRKKGCLVSRKAIQGGKKKKGNGLIG